MHNLHPVIPGDVDLHAILLGDETLAPLAQEMADTRARGNELEAAAAAAAEAYKAERRAAFDHGQLFDKPKPEDPAEARSYANRQVRLAEDAVRAALPRRAPDLVEQMEAREQALLGQVPDMRVRELEALTVEVAQLKESKIRLRKYCDDKLQQRWSVPVGSVTAGALVDAALISESLIGRTPPPPPPGVRTPVFAEGLARA